eukprot:TRINITY_DN5726_c2_g2_i1.p1 TRINITY_DN5726_c2_g2~~TRINITY_DN5726_c2_g2_i1.p1  ORF type:complete len:237 (-),score=42.40 TRINITY_DN5726_c2_g2_i1:209-919(-)
METEFETKSTPQVNVHFAYAGASGVVEELGEHYFDQGDRSLADVLLDQESIYQSLQTNTGNNLARPSSSTDSSLAHDQSDRKREAIKEEGESSGVQKDMSQIEMDEAFARLLQDSEYQDDITKEINTTGTTLAARQDNIDPDFMTYEELQSLGDSIGTHYRGLPQELICILQEECTSTHTTGDKDEECLICLMEYEEDDILMTLPCKHNYHSDCVTKWLQIKKICPVCYEEVFGSS